MSKWWDKDWFERLVDESSSFEELADKAGCGVNTAKRWVNRHDLDFDGDHESNSLTEEAKEKLNDAEWLRSDTTRKRHWRNLRTSLILVQHLFTGILTSMELSGWASGIT